MPEIVFYVLPDAISAACDHYACVLAEEAMRQRQRVLIRTRDAEHSARLDTLLWSFRDNSFVPHAWLEADPPPDAIALASAVHISHRDGADARLPAGPVTLINLADQPPSQLDSYALLYELVYNDDASKQTSRERFRFYRARGHPPQHQIIRQRILSQT